MLAIVVIGIMLSMFYGQYRWLANGIVNTGVEQHDMSLAYSFEQRARSALRLLANDVAGLGSNPDRSTAKQILQSRLERDSNLVGIRYREAGGDIELVDIDNAARASASIDPLTAFLRKHLG